MAIGQESKTKQLGRLISEFRDKRAWSQEDLAQKLGVSRITVGRWEKGETTPSVLALKQLEEFEDWKFINSSPVVTTRGILPSPYVINGPQDQNGFHQKLIKLQQPHLEIDNWKYRISLVESIDGELTSQSQLEDVSPDAKSWNSNYGTHGWHRYVGRFPPHLVRALLNYFKAGKDDLICDPFAGSGTTLVEARLLGIPSVGIEICPLSCMISRTKSSFPASTSEIYKMVREFELFYSKKWAEFTSKHSRYTHKDVLKRKGNNIEYFSNIERWFTTEALLGVSISTEFAARSSGFLRDIFLVALSGKMRSIGNVDVDVIRAEYRKTPRKNVDVLKLVRNQLLKMIEDIELTAKSHSKTIAREDSVTIREGSILDAKFKEGSISHIITSPPYGVESLSYLRTHLLSYRSLSAFLHTDPYEFGSKVIGSEYLPKDLPDISQFLVSKVSPTFRQFFKQTTFGDSKNHQIRVIMMMKFFEEMDLIISNFYKWLKPGGYVAFVIGNKRIDQQLIPTDKIISEIFSAKNFKLDQTLSHKLKTNNSNSKVPWQDRVIDQEFIMIFKKP